MGKCALGGVVVATVEGAGELEDLGSAGEAASEAQGVHGGLGAGADEFDGFGAGNGFDHRFGELDHRRMHEVERGAAFQLPGDCLVYLGPAMSQEQRAGAQVVVDVLSTIDVPDVAALAPL